VACQVAEVAALYQVVGLESSAAALLAAEPASAVSASAAVAVELLSEPPYLSVACVCTGISAGGPYSVEAVSVALLTGLYAFEAGLPDPSLPVGLVATDSFEPGTAASL